MTASRWHRLWLAVLLGSVPVLVTGCLSTVSGQGSPFLGGTEQPVEAFEQVQPPELGTCLDTVRGGTGPLGPPMTLNCSEPHGGEVAKVVEVPDALDGSYPTDDDLSSDAWGTLLYSREGCGGFQLPNTYLGAREQDNLLVDAYAYLPKKGAWDAGARWLACVVEYRTGFAENANAPGRMAEAMRGSDAAAYRECWFGPETIYDVVPCSQPHEAEPIGDNVPAEPGTPYPSDPLSRRPFVDECTNQVLDYLEGALPDGYAAGIYLPRDEEWAQYPAADCVILDSGGRRTSGSAVDA